MTEGIGRDCPHDVVVADNPAKNRYEARVDGELVAFVDYLLTGNRVVFTHAETFPRWEHQGIGSVLARGALDDVIAQEKLITPLCPFIVAFINRNPAYAEHVDTRHRTTD